MDDMEMLFTDLNEEEVDALLKDIDIPYDKELSDSVRSRLGIRKADTLISFPIKKILPFAAAFCIVIAAAFSLLSEKNLFPVTAETTVVTTTQEPPVDNPLMVAISSGDEDIIQKLLSVPGIITQETLDFALNLSGRISYNTLHEIAVSVRENLGSTGLDSLVESALLGDSQKVISELDTRESMTMTPFEKLAFFFCVAFCDSETVDKFVSRGYDINLKDASGNSIYAIAEKYGNEDTMQYAVSKGITS